MNAQLILCYLLLIDHCMTRRSCCFDPGPWLGLERRLVDLRTQVLVHRGCPPVLPQLLREPDPDNWGTEYLALCVDEVASVVSAGPDRQFGTVDDLAVGDAYCWWPTQNPDNQWARDRSRSFCHRRYSPE